LKEYLLFIEWFFLFLFPSWNIEYWQKGNTNTSRVIILHYVYLIKKRKLVFFLLQIVCSAYHHDVKSSPRWIIKFCSFRQKNPANNNHPKCGCPPGRDSRVHSLPGVNVTYMFTGSFYEVRSQKRKEDSQVNCAFCAFGIFTHKSSS